jgi:hypothetical protein
VFFNLLDLYLHWGEIFQGKTTNLKGRGEYLCGCFRAIKITAQRCWQYTPDLRATRKIMLRLAISYMRAKLEILLSSTYILGGYVFLTCQPHDTKPASDIFFFAGS